MTNPLVSRTSASDLNKQIEQHLQELADATDKARTSQEMIRYLDFCAKFHHYSAGNIWLILIANPEATYVAGYHKWKTMGRWVKKGEHGIPILAPVHVKEGNKDANEELHLIGFRVVYVYDVSQTDGDPFPSVPNWKSPVKNLWLQNRLLILAIEKGVKVSIKPLVGEIQGVSKGGNIILSPRAGTKTLVHELAHEFLHSVEKYQLSIDERELEAEAVAYVVCSYFGISDLASPNYLALWGASRDSILARFQRIVTLADELIQTLVKGKEEIVNDEKDEIIKPFKAFIQFPQYL